MTRKPGDAGLFVSGTPPMVPRGASSGKPSLSPAVYYEIAPRERTSCFRPLPIYRQWWNRRYTQNHLTQKLASYVSDSYS